MLPGIIFGASRLFFLLTTRAPETLAALRILPACTIATRVLTDCVPLSVLIVFLMRFTRQQRENVRMAEDLRQAQEVQQMLIPAVPPATPGFAIEHVYLPAQEVGGDFFQVLPAADRSLLIVIGDVSGKGLQAAMTVSAIVGALRDAPERRPPQILAHLNRVLCGQIGGFVTYAATLIAENGVLTIANAGHLSPYRNGAEMHVESGLPLGISPDIQYAQTALPLAPGDRLTFMSDGVVEARNQRGDLFGFDRTRQVSTQPAAAIAAAALAHGQEDDITVLTLAFAPAEVHA